MVDIRIKRNKYIFLFIIGKYQKMSLKVSKIEILTITDDFQLIVLNILKHTGDLCPHFSDLCLNTHVNYLRDILRSR